MGKVRFYETVNVTVLPIKEELIDNDDKNAIYLDRDPGIIEMLEMIAELPIKDQVFMMSNTLTISGFTQREIAEALGVAYQTYRNRLLDIRQELRDTHSFENVL